MCAGMTWRMISRREGHNREEWPGWDSRGSHLQLVQASQLHRACQPHLQPLPEQVGRHEVQSTTSISAGTMIFCRSEGGPTTAAAAAQPAASGVSIVPSKRQQKQKKDSVLMPPPPSLRPAKPSAGAGPTSNDADDAPPWAGPPPSGCSLEVFKGGQVVESLPLTKAATMLGRYVSLLSARDSSSQLAPCLPGGVCYRNQLNCCFLCHCCRKLGQACWVCCTCSHWHCLPQGSRTHHADSARRNAAIIRGRVLRHAILALLDSARAISKTMQPPEKLWHS